MIHTYKTLTTIPASITETWNFFSAAGNLAKITPPEMDFKILSDVEGKEIYHGMQIDYIVRPLLGIPMRWKTEIIKVDKPHTFTDRQLKGPYKLWEHTHSFTENNEGTLMEDIVDYELPFGYLGEISHQLVIKKKIGQIFTYREAVLKTLFIPGV